MAEVCYNSCRFLKRWFDNLDSINLKMADMNHLTKTNLREFSRQTLDELLMPSAPGFEVRKKNLNMHCERRLDLLVPDDTYNDMTKSYLWFLEYIAGVSAQRRLLTLFYCVAHNLNKRQFPDESQPADFPDKSINEAFQKKSFANNTILKKLDRMLKDNLNPAFYPDSSVLKNGDASIKQTIDKIVSGEGA